MSNDAQASEKPPEAKLCTLEVACVMLCCSLMKLYDLMDSGELECLTLAPRMRRIVVKSIDDHIARGVAKSRNPETGKLIKDTRLDGFRGAKAKKPLAKP
jgi:hypothetical protein